MLMPKKTKPNTNSKSTRVELRMPLYIYNDLIKIQNANNFNSMSDTIRFALACFILRFNAGRNENE